MKTHYLYCVILLILSGLLASEPACSRSSVGYSTTTSDPEYLQQGTYLVIGVFAYEDNAESLSQYAQMQGFSAKYAYYPSRGYYYVYTFTADSATQVVEKCLHLRSTSEFEDAWVFRAYDAHEIAESGHSSSGDWETPGMNAPLEKTNPMATVSTAANDTVAAASVTPSTGKSSRKKEKAELGYDVFFRTLGNENKPVTATVNVVDGSHAKSVKKCQSNQQEVLEHDRLLTQRVQLITYAIGYRKATFDLSLDQPVNDTTASYVSITDDEVIEVKMPLEKLQQGDVQVMFNTYFYGNASVMREKSRYELEELLRFLQENPTTTIKLHGHTNGNSRGITYLYSKEHNNFFNIRRSKEYTKRGIGAKKLSEMRAETIRQYLIKQGVAEDRIETKGWGGKNMLYDADSPLARNNIRVEIEVLSE